MGFTGRWVARVLGITQEYVSMLRARARAEGSAGLMCRRGRPAPWGASDLGRARSWRGEGVTDAAIGKRLGVHGSRWPGRWLALIGRRGRCGVPGGHLAGPGGGRAGRRGSDQHRPAACGGAAGSRAAGGRPGNTVYGVGRDRDRLLPVPVCRGDDAVPLPEPGRRPSDLRDVDRWPGPTAHESPAPSNSSPKNSTPHQRLCPPTPGH